LKSEGFRRWVALLNYRKANSTLTTQAIEDVVRTLDIIAYSEGQRYDPFVRVGQQDSKLYLDLCDDGYRAAEITAGGWQVIARPPVKFLRSSSARALPVPQRGHTIKTLRRFVNTSSEDDFKLIVAWLVSALRPGRPFPILIVNGAHATGKSVLCRLLQLLIDPDLVPGRGSPRDERDLVLGASNTWISLFDNLSNVNGYLPDALCRLASGGGFRTRALHTNRDEAVFAVQRPVLLNGIPSLTEQADVARRSLVINLASMQGDQRRAEDDFWSEFEQLRPFILGALLDAASCALREIDRVQLVRPESMADFEKWSIAASPALGWSQSEFEAAYRRNQSAVAEDTFEGDPIAVAVHGFVLEKNPDGWEGTATDLLIVLDNHVAEHIRKSRSWPKTAAQLGNRIKRAKPLLEHKGFTVERRHSGMRTITIMPPKAS
jgi:putative DNA primase/helicase